MSGKISVSNHSSFEPVRVDVAKRIAPDISIQAAPTRKSDRIGLHIPSERGVVMAMPVVGEAALQLEPLAGEAQVDVRRVRPDIGNPAERRIDHVPHPVRQAPRRIIGLGTANLPFVIPRTESNRSD